MTLNVTNKVRKGNIMSTTNPFLHNIVLTYATGVSLKTMVITEFGKSKVFSKWPKFSK